MAGFFKGVKSEFKKIIWPSRELLIKETGAVVAISVLIGVVIAVLDWIIQLGFSFIL